MENQESPRNEPQQPAPVAPLERFNFIDILRGFAVFGILVANMAGYSGRSSLPTFFAESLDQWIVNLSRFFIEAKFYSLFSLLFGWGMALQMSRAQAKGIPFVPTYIRRMLALLLIGLIHSIFIWTGDILVLYAILGLGLLLFRNLSVRTVLLASGLFLMIRVVLTLPVEAIGSFQEAYESATSFLRSGTYPDSLYATGTYLEITRLRMQETLSGNSWVLYFVGPVFSMFLLGLYIGKRRIVEDLEDHLSLVRRVMWVGLAVGLVFNALFVWSTNNVDTLPGQYSMLIRIGARTIAAPAMMLFYASGITLLTRRESWFRRLSPLGNVGRMALTNYLLQSIVITLVFYGYGLGLYGQVDPSFGLLLTVLFFVLQIRWSAWWLERYQYGPAEWVWRLLTYGRRPPLRINEEPDSLKPLPVIGRVQQFLRRAPPLAVLGGVWVLLLIWGVGLLAWSARLDEQASRAPFEVLFQATPTPGPSTASQGGTGSMEDAHTPVQPPPVLQPLAFNPGGAAAAGDTLALAQEFNLESALDQIEALADPRFQGREAGSPGGHAAGDYIAEQFARYRLQPAGDNGTFFQKFPVNYSPLTSVPELEIRSADGQMLESPTLFEDFSPVVRMYAGEGQGAGPVVWVDNCQQDDFDAVDVLGKIALCDAGPFGQEPHLAGRQALEHGASGLLLLTDSAERPPDFGDTYREVWVPVPLPVLRVTPSLAESLISGSGFDLEGLQAAKTSLPLETEVVMSVDLHQSACPVEGCFARNVLGVIPGRDPEVADELVIIGAHYDHLGGGPEGTYWAGANDNASGTAALIEIARAWDEQGYVPRRTVLFAAWDAEEKGLLGSQYYVANPRFPLEDTISAIMMDMVGAGADTLMIHGEADSSAHLQAVAEALEIPAEMGNLGRSDHIPFINAGVPSNLLIWWDPENQIPHYHRTIDLPGVIEPDKLNAAALVAGTSLLDIAESEPAIRELLGRRAAYLEARDLPAFIETSLAARAESERTWYDGLQSLDPIEVSINIEELAVNGPTATAGLEYVVVYPGREPGDQPRTMTIDVDSGFVQDSEGWVHAGPNLVALDLASILAEDDSSAPRPLMPLMHPEGLDIDWVELSQAAGTRLAEIAVLAQLPIPTEAGLLLFEDYRSLRNNTTFTMPDQQQIWVQSGQLRIIYSTDLADNHVLDQGLSQLLLAEAGLSEAAAPWLWHGLPLAVQAEFDPIEVQKQQVPALSAALAAGEDESTLAEAWAATDYVLGRVGWAGLGEFIQELGSVCETLGCSSPEQFDTAFQAALAMDAADFETAWQDHWQSRLDSAQVELDDLAGRRTAAVLDGDQNAYLETVDSNNLQLIQEEAAWFASRLEAPLDEFSVAASPLAWLDDGRLLASVNVTTRMISDEEGVERVAESLPVVVGRDETEPVWSGPLLEGLEGETLDIQYPEGELELASALLEAGETYFATLEESLEFVPDEKLVVALYENSDQFETSIDIAFPAKDWIGGWSGEGQSIKLRLGRGPDGAPAGPEAYIPDLLDQMTRFFLLGEGVEAEWLLKGLSAVLIGHSDGGLTQQRIAAGLPDLEARLEELELGGLSDIRADYQLSEAGDLLSRIQAWDSLRYLIEEHGWDRLLRLVASHSRGAGLDSAARSSLGTTLEEFEETWRSSLARGHVDDEWQAVAEAFSEAAAVDHVDFLSRPELAGRQAGSPGDLSAQTYIAELFGEYGLQPAGERLGGGSGSPSFFQSFPITATFLTVSPRLELTEIETGMVENLIYRADFRPVQTDSRGEINLGPVDMVWVDDPDYETLLLEGEVILRRPSWDLAEEITQAVDNGAGGLILLGFDTAEEVLGKDLTAESELPTGEIPVIVLTRAGTEKILDAAGASLLNLPKTAPGKPLGLAALMNYQPPEVRQAETSNLLGLLPGSDPFLENELTLLGAHFDHVGYDPSLQVCVDGECDTVPGLQYSGANDNASGVGVLLEIARLWHEQGYQPKRSVLFAAWGANELGELGSRYFLENPTVPLEHALGVVQLDGVGGGEGFNLSAFGDWGRDGLFMASLQNAGELLEEKLVLVEGAVPSDHTPFREAGFPGLLVQWRLANEANLPDELTNRVDSGRLGVTGRMISLALMALAGGT